MTAIKKTGLSFASGVKLSASDLTTLNNTVNALVDAVNSLIMATFDVNQESGNYTNTYTLLQAIQFVANNRRQLGMKIRFRSESGMFVEYSYIGYDLNDDNFTNVDNWANGVEVVDGGEF